MLDPDICYRAMESRDKRFEGSFIAGVKTTGIYCRPGCPARIPKRSNVEFFACAAAAERAGLRACRRCRPDASPTSPAAVGTPITVTRALRLIDEGGLGEGGVEALAARLGVGGRHLRRLFDQHLGASPIEVAQSRRAHFARKLIEQTSLPMTEIALAAGFGSVRRFNDAVRAAFGAPPTALRAREIAEGGRDGAITLTLPFRPPLAWDELLAFLGARAIPGVERVADGVYARTFDGGVLSVARASGAMGATGATSGEGTSRASGTARERDSERHLHLTIELEPATLAMDSSAPSVDLFAIVGRVRRLLDLDADPAAIAAHLGDVAAIPGLRVPGAWDGFELAVRAILGQQVTVKGATTLAGRLVQRFGEPLASPSPERGLTHRFPTPARLARAEIETIGLPAARAASIRAIAQAVTKSALDLDASAGLDATITTLTALPGIGPWTAHYIAMRASREPDAFPSGDLVLRKRAADRAASITTPLSARELDARAEAWRPWRAYAAMHLWHRKDVS